MSNSKINLKLRLTPQTLAYYTRLATRYDYNRLSYRTDLRYTPRPPHFGYGISPVINSLIQNNPNPDYYTPSPTFLMWYDTPEERILDELTTSLDIVDNPHNHPREQPSLPLWYTPSAEPRTLYGKRTTRTPLLLHATTTSILISISDHFSIYHLTSNQPSTSTSSRITAVLEAIGQENLL